MSRKPKGAQKPVGPSAYEQTMKEVRLHEALGAWRQFPEQRESRTQIVLEALFDAAGSSKSRRRDFTAIVARFFAEGE